MTWFVCLCIRVCIHESVTACEYIHFINLTTQHKQSKKSVRTINTILHRNQTLINKNKAKVGNYVHLHRVHKELSAYHYTFLYVYTAYNFSAPSRVPVPKLVDSADLRVDDTWRRRELHCSKVTGPGPIESDLAKRGFIVKEARGAVEVCFKPTSCFPRHD